MPEYTLVSGLPSYEAALELLQKTPQSSCLIVYPSVFNVFNKHERASTATTATATTATVATVDAATAQTATLCEAAAPLLPATATAATTATTPTCEGVKPNLVPSYAEVFGFKTVDEKKKHSTTKSPTKDHGDKC